MTGATGAGRKIFHDGNTACAEGAVAAGVEFCRGYPITPATEIAHRLAERLPQGGGLFLQMEDEISSIAAIIGASWTGKKVMTALPAGHQPDAGKYRFCRGSGRPPCVIVNVQRGAPTTGMPTQGYRAIWSKPSAAPMEIMRSSPFVPPPRRRCLTIR